MKLKDLHEEAKRCIKGNFWKLFFVILLNYLVSISLTAISETFESVIFNILFFVLTYAITVPLSYGVIVSFMKSSREESFSVFDFISDGMKAFKRVWCVFGRTILKLIVPIIIFIVGYIASFVLLAKIIVDTFAGQNSNGTTYLALSAIILVAVTIYYVVKSLSYSLTNYILYDNPDLSAKEIVEESNIMMTGNKMAYIKVLLYTFAVILILILVSSAIMSYVPGLLGPVLGLLLLLVAVVVLLPYLMGLQVAFYNLLKNSTEKVENIEE